MSEPFLASFIPPRFLLERLVNRTPFLAASRQYEGPFVRPWRVMTYGDPLMLVLPPKRSACRGFRRRDLNWSRAKCCGIR